MAIVLWLVLLEGLYLRALRVLKRRGVTVPRFQIAMWHTAMALWIIGLTLLAMVTVRSFRGHFSPEEHRGVEVPGIYWHFVDIMWVIVYTTIYIL